MVEYEIKYKKKEGSIICGVIFGIVSLSWIIMLIFIIHVGDFNHHIRLGSILAISLFLANAILNFILAKNNITQSSQTYIKIYGNGLEIFKGIFHRKKFIEFKDIEEARLVGNKMYIILKDYVSPKEAEIYLDAIYMKDLDRLLIDLEKNNISIKKL